MEKKYWFSDQHNNGTSRRDFYIKYDSGNTTLLKRYQRLGLIKHCQNDINGYAALKDELVWEIGTTKLRFFQIDSLKDDQKTALAKLSQLQSKIEALESPESLSSKSLLAFKIQLSELIRDTLQECESELRSYHFTFQRVNDVLKFCLKHVDEFELKEQIKALDIPANNDSISIKDLHEVGHIYRLSNRTPAGIVQGLSYNAYEESDEILLNESDTKSQLEPNWHHRKLPLIGISVQTVLFVTLLIASPWIFLLLQSSAIGSWFIYLFTAAPMTMYTSLSFASLIFLASVLNLTPEQSDNRLDVVICYLKRSITMLTIVLIFLNLIVPINPISMYLGQFFVYLSPTALSSIVMIMTLFTYLMLTAVFEHISPSQTIQEDEEPSFDLLKRTRLFIQPEDNYSWRHVKTVFQNPLLFALFLCIVAGALYIEIQFNSLKYIVYGLSAILNVSNTMALMILVSIACFTERLLNSINATASNENEHDQINEHWLENSISVAIFTIAMGAIFYLDFSIISNAFTILTAIFGITSTIAINSIGCISILFLMAAVYFLPHGISITEAFKRNPIIQAEKIFMELNEFYYKTGLKHPIVITFGLVCFILSMCSFYVSFIPNFIHELSIYIATALLNAHVSTFLFAFAASIMITNFIILIHNTYDRGDDSFLVRSMSFIEKYPIDAFIYGTLMILGLNLLVLTPFVQAHLGTVALIGTMSFCFKFVLIAYDFYRDKNDKSFIASLLMMLLWPLLVIKKLIAAPTQKNLNELSHSFEKSLIHLILIFAYDIPIRIFLRVFEVALLACFNLVKTFCDLFSLDFIHHRIQSSEKNIFSFIDKLRYCAEITYFMYQDKYRIWHLLGVFGLTYMTFSLITQSLYYIFSINLSYNFAFWLSYNQFSLAFANSMVFEIMVLHCAIGLLITLISSCIHWTNYACGAQTEDEFIDTMKKLVFNQMIIAGILFSLINIAYIIMPFFPNALLMAASTVTLMTQLYSGFEVIFKGIEITFKEFGIESKESKDFEEKTENRVNKDVALEATSPSVLDIFSYRYWNPSS